jgi:hypothetical protein
MKDFELPENVVLEAAHTDAQGAHMINDLVRLLNENRRLDQENTMMGRQMALLVRRTGEPLRFTLEELEQPLEEQVLVSDRVGEDVLVELISVEEHRRRHPEMYEEEAAVH